MKTKNKLKIAFFGSSLISSYWNGAATYYRGIIKSLAALGHEITFYEPDAFERQKHRDIEDPDWTRVVIYPNTKAAVEEVVRHACNSDVIIKASGVGVFDRELEEWILQCQYASDQRVIFWDVDAPATLQRLDDDPSDPFHKLIPQYDAIFTYGGGEPVRQKYLSFGAKDVHLIYNALDPETHFPEKEDPVLRCELAFLGNRLPDREKRVKEFFVKPAKLLPNDTFALGGNGWKEEDVPSNVALLGHVGTDMHNTLNCSAKAILNISRQSMADYGFSPATRVFEAAGAGACIITDDWKGIELFLEPGKEVLVAKNGEEVAQIMASLTEKEAHDIGCAARARILSEHTYRHRAEQIEEIFQQSEKRTKKSKAAKKLQIVK
ncbi:MAG: CgeB family protein [Candidatus Cyclobacteriaceae bacterium M2_1C_046]